MPKTQYLPVKDLSIDLKNPRTRETTSEVDAVHALIALRPRYFWDLMRSLIEDGYNGTENILVLDTGDGRKVVREGNRRIGAMKIIHGLMKRDSFELPRDIGEELDRLAPEWKTENETVPCSIYDATEIGAITRLVRLTHARGESAGRLNWESLARSRFNRDVSGGNQPALDLLERYLETAKGLSEEVRTRWGGAYPLTVLNEALQRVASRYNLAGVRELVVKADDDISLQKILGSIIHDIGTDKLETRHVRDAAWGPSYGLPAAPQKPNGADIKTGASGGPGANANGGGAAANAGTSNPTSTPPAAPAPRGKRKAVPLDDPRSVYRTLSKFAPTGTNSSKVVTLLFEARKLKLDKHPISFCFLLRSMLEISARTYCSGKKLSTFNQKKNRDMTLSEILRHVAKDIATRSADQAVKDHMDTAQAEVNGGQLSVFMLNQLVHMPNVIPTQDQIIAGFHKIFPLLEELNR